MTESSTALRAALAPYINKSTRLALALFCRDLGLVVVATALALYVENYALKTLFAIVAGVAIAALFVIGHDAAHNALTPSKKLNGVLGRTAFLPALHNFTLWRIVHNRMHHLEPCVKDKNSWSPRSKAEYDALPWWSRAAERLYRTPVLGFAPYYVVNRWLREKFCPPRHLRETRRFRQWTDFALLLGFLGAVFAAFFGATLVIDHLAYWEAVVWGFLIPQVVWNTLMGFTVYVQHTHPEVPWFRTEDEAVGAGQTHTSRTVHVVFPKWYGHLSNHIMDHAAHHVHTKIPLYRLAKAQKHLNELLGHSAVIEKFTPFRLFSIMRQCQLYDFDSHRWLSFDGTPTAEPLARAPLVSPVTA